MINKIYSNIIHYIIHSTTLPFRLLFNCSLSNLLIITHNCLHIAMIITNDNSQQMSSLKITRTHKTLVNILHSINHSLCQLIVHSAILALHSKTHHTELFTKHLEQIFVLSYLPFQSICFLLCLVNELP